MDAIKNIADLTFLDKGNSGAGVVTIDWTDHIAQKLTLTDHCILAFTAPGRPKTLVLKLAQNATGGYTVSFPSSIKWTGGVRPSWSGGANAIDIVTLYYDGTNYFGEGSIDYQTGINLVDNCLLWSPLNEASGTNAPDITGNGNNGTLATNNGGDLPTWETGKIKNCVGFDDADENYIDFGTGIQFYNLTDWSISLWAKLTNLTGDKTLLHIDGQFFIGYYSTDTYWEMSYYYPQGSPAWNKAKYSQASPAVDTWYHIVGVWDEGNSAKIYIDGVEGATALSGNSNLYEASGNLYAGGWKTSDIRWIDGLIDNIMIFNKALSTDEIAYLYNGGISIEALS